LGKNESSRMVTNSNLARHQQSCAQITRRHFLAAGAACSLACLPGARILRAGAGKPLTIVFGWVPNAEYADIFVGMDKGYFAKAGVDLKYVGGGPNAPVSLVTMAAGQAQIATSSWLQLLDAAAHGNDFVVIAAMIPVTPEGLMSLPKKPVLKPADLPGTRFLVQGPMERDVLDAVFKINHLPLERRYVPAGFSPEALLAGAGDAYFCFVTNQPIVFEDMKLVAGKDFFVARMEQFGYRVPSQLLVVDRKNLNADRATYLAFLRAMLQGNIDNKKDPAYGAQLVVSKYGRDLGFTQHQQTRLNELQIALERSPGTRGPYWISDEQIVSMFEMARATGRANLPEPAKIIDQSLLAEAYKGLSF